MYFQLRIIFGNEELDYSLVVFSKDCDVRYFSQTNMYDSSGHGAEPAPAPSSSDVDNTEKEPIKLCHKLAITSRNETKVFMVPKHIMFPTEDPEKSSTPQANTIGNSKIYVNAEKLDLTLGFERNENLNGFGNWNVCRPPEKYVLLNTQERVEMGIKWEMPFWIPPSYDMSATYEHERNSTLPDAPQRSIDVTFFGRVNLSYCPFIDKKRAELQKYFFPPDYVWKTPTVTPQPGDMRDPLELNISFKFSEVSMDFKFKQKDAAPGAVS